MVNTRIESEVESTMPRKTKKEIRSPLFDKAISRLRASKLKVTPARTALLAFLCEHHGPFRIEEIHKKTDADLVTVYRNLASLEEVGLITKVDFRDSTVRYELRDPEAHHHHVICKSCDKVDEVSLCTFEFMDKQLTKMGYARVEHSLSFFAICPRCQTSALAR